MYYFDVGQVAATKIYASLPTQTPAPQAGMPSLLLMSAPWFPWLCMRQDAVEVANAEAIAAGAFGSSKTRYFQGGQAVPPPAGAEWHTVRVRVPPRFAASAKLLEPHPGAQRHTARVHVPARARTVTARMSSNASATIFCGVS